MSRGVPSGFLLRLVDRDRALAMQAAPELSGGVVLSTRSLALPAGGALRQAVEVLRVPYLMDPDTAVLEEVTAQHPRAGWLRAMPAAALIGEPPITPEHFDNDGRLDLFARAVAQAQRGAVAFSAGYFRVGSARDPWRAVNRRLLGAMSAMAAGRPVCGWLELSLASLVDGLVRELADDYRETDYVALRVAGLTPSAVTNEQADAVLDAVAAIGSRGPRVVLDSIGCHGSAALAAGAHAFTGGGWHHRSVPLIRVHQRSPSAPPLGYEVPLEWRQLPVDEARDLLERGVIDVCGEPSCDVLSPAVGNARQPRLLRRHFVHAAQIDARFSQRFAVADVAREMLSSPDRAAQVWGRALSRRAAAASTSIHSPR